MSTLKTTNLQNASAASPAIVLAADGSATAQVSSLNGGPIAGARNRIINGDMRIDQRNAGGSVNMSAVVYPVDRWAAFEDTDGAMTAQRSTVVPPGFTNSIVCTTTTADASLAAGQYARVWQSVEGLNVADLGWGTADARAVTVSFWARSSLTGTFGGSVANSAFNRSYPFTYAVSAANTWEYKTIVIPGDTAGTWLTDNGIGLQLNFSLGSGTTFSGTAGSWAGSGLLTATGATSVVGTNGATFYITGVQLETGTVATPFERRSYGQELALCERYYQGIKRFTGAVRNVSGSVAFGCGTQTIPAMRSAPTVTISNNAGAVNGVVNSTGTTWVHFDADTGSANAVAIFNYVCAIEL
jgi:hypothetical protein